MKWVGTFLGVALVVALSACGSDTSAPAEIPVKDVVQKLDPADATKLKLGDSLTVVADLPRDLEGDRVFFSSFASDHELVGAATPDETNPQYGHANTQSRPVMYDLTSKEFTVLDDGGRPVPTWVADVVGNDEAVVWVEGTDYNIAHSTFTIYAYDRATRKVATIAEFDDPKDQVVYQNDLAIAGRTAYLSTAPFRKGESAVHAISVDGSAPPSQLVPGGDRVRIDGDTLRYWVRNPRDETEYPKQFTYDLKTGATTPVPVNKHASEDGFCGSEVTKSWEMWCTGRTMRPGPERQQNQALITIKETSGRTTEFKPFPVDSLNAPLPHDVIDLGRWTGISVPTDDGQQREFLVDLDTGQMQVFPDNTSFGAMSPGRATVLVSSFGDKNGRQRVVKIPTR